MFESVEMAPADPILGLGEAFAQDPNPRKINLSVGVFKDATGQTPVLATVKEAERRLLESEKTKSYKPIAGDPAYADCVQKLLFGADHPLLKSGRLTTAHAPGGTGALRVVADYLRQLHPGTSVWVSDPTWVNHNQIFKSVGLNVSTYPYFDAAANAVNFPALMGLMKKVPAGDVVLLHACCHNPTGADLSESQWEELGRVLADRGVVPLLDFAYQGFADGVDQDAASTRILADQVEEMFICSSFSKNFGLYNERTGALTVLGSDARAIAAVASQIKVCIRTHYSNPPAHGGAIVTAILTDPALRVRWEQELAAMRDRIHAMRRLFVDTLKVKGARRDFSFLITQKGMFSFSGLSKDQVEKLRKDDGIYMVGSGRINMAGMTESNMNALCEAIVRVL